MQSQRRQKWFKKFSDPSKKNKKRNAQPDRQMTENSTTTMVYRHSGQERQQLTAVWRNGGFSASYVSFVVYSSAVLRLNFYAKNPPHRQAENRYHQYLDETESTAYNSKIKEINIFWALFGNRRFVVSIYFYG